MAAMIWEFINPRGVVRQLEQGTDPGQMAVFDWEGHGLTEYTPITRKHAGQRGETFVDVDAQKRVLTLYVNYQGSTRAERGGWERGLVRDPSPRRGLGTTPPGREDAQERRIDCSVSPGLELALAGVARLARQLPLSFYAPDPDF